MNNPYIVLLKNNSQVRLLWLAQIMSLLGDWFGTIAAIILVNRYTDSGLAISILFMARGLPSFVFAPVVGVIADRFNRKRILITTDILQTIVGFSFLLVFQTESITLLYFLTVLQFTLAAFFEPARAAFLPNLVHSESELLHANTLSNISWSFMLAIGAVIGGGVTALFGIEIAIVVNAFTFLISAAFIAFIRHIEEKSDENTTSSNGFLDFMDGLRYVRQRPEVASYVTVKGLSQIGSIDAMFTLYAASVFIIGDEGAITLAVLYMAFGVGAVIGPIIANRFNDNSKIAFQKWILYGFLMIPIGWFGFGIAPTLGIAAFFIVIRAMGNSINWTYSSVQLQLTVPDQYLGRVFSLDFSMFTLSYTVAVIVTGLLVDVLNLSPREIAIVFAIAGSIPTAIWYWVMNRHARSELTLNQAIPESIGD